MKILHVGGSLCGGAGGHILSLVKRCDPRRFESTVAMAEGSPMRGEFQSAGIRVVPLTLDHRGGLRKNIVAFRQLAAFLRRETFDVIHTHTSVAGALGRVAARMFTRAPTVHMLHAFASHLYQSSPARSAALFVERRLDRFTDWYIAGSRAMVERGVSQRIFSADKVVLIHNGIDLAQFDRDQGDEDSAEHSRVRTSGSQVTVGFLGRLEKQKGVEYLVRAAAVVRGQNRNVRFLIAGDGTLRTRLEELSRALGVEDSIEFVGWASNVAQFLRRIDILAMPSLWEAFGLSVGEGMAMGKPVIASRIEGLCEVVEEDKTGFLVAPADPQALARAILQLADDPARRLALGRQGRVRVEERFTLDLMVARHEEFYERLIGGGGGRSPGDESVSHQEPQAALSMAN